MTRKIKEREKMTLTAREQDHAERTREQREAKRLRRYRAQIHEAIARTKKVEAVEVTAEGPFRTTDKKDHQMGGYPILDHAGRWVAYGPSRDKARAMAREANAGTRTFVRVVGVVDQDSAMEQLGWKRVGTNGEGHAPELKFRRLS